MKVLSAVQMSVVDRLTTERYGVPSQLLMENAAQRTVEALNEHFQLEHGTPVLVVCGMGNNGGDGAAIARLLHIRGANVRIVLLGRVDQTKGDARLNFEAVRRLAETAGGALSFAEIEAEAEVHAAFGEAGPDFIIDAIFGTGLARPAAGIYRTAIDFINGSGAPVVAVDIPSGVASDSPELIGPAVRADMTITFTSPKPASVLPPACDLGGRVIVGRIGSPDELIEESGSFLNLLEAEVVANWLAASRRDSNANKGDAGKVLILAGSRGKTGAACLAGEAALRAGAGLVTIATPESSQPVVAARVIPECMTEPLPETAEGFLASEALDRALALADERDVVAIGPGIGATDTSTRDFVRLLTERRARPLVIDADGLNCLAPWPEALSGADELPLVLTPHPGEFARLLDTSVENVVANRVDLVRDFAVAHRVTVVLKLSRSLIASPDGQVYINATGNSALATGGTGDVLTGMIAGLIAQWRGPALEATLAAVYLHGLSGDLAAARTGTRSLIASDLISHLGEAFLAVGGDDERPSR